MSNFLLDKEMTDMLDKGLAIRADLVDKLYKNGDVDNNKDIRVIKEILCDVDTAINTRLNLNIKAEAAKSTSEINSTIVAVIKAKSKLRSENKNLSNIDKDAEQINEVDYVPVPGELTSGHIKLDINEVIKNGEVVIEEDDDEV